MLAGTCWNATVLLHDGADVHHDTKFVAITLLLGLHFVEQGRMWDPPIRRAATSSRPIVLFKPKTAGACRRSCSCKRQLQALRQTTKTDVTHQALLEKDVSVFRGQWLRSAKCRGFTGVFDGLVMLYVYSVKHGSALIPRSCELSAGLSEHRVRRILQERYVETRQRA